MFNLAIVTKVLPGRHGVLVAFRNGVEFFDSGNTDQHFVRVLERRAHSRGGATINLPEVGELGLVVDVDPGLSVWMGSLPFEESNQMDPRPGMEGWRHASGVQVIVLENGDTQFAHPAGLRLSITRDGEMIPEMQGSMPLERLVRADASPRPIIRLVHASGFDLKVDGDGVLTLTSPESVRVDSAKDVTLKAGGKLVAEVTGDAEITTGGNATLKAEKIILDGPVECTGTLKVAGETTLQNITFSTHKHTCATPGSPTSPAF